MVEITEVKDEHFAAGQAGPPDDDDYSDTDSEISTESDDDVADETLGERLYALRDMVPPATRNWLAGSAATAKATVTRGGWLAGRAFWITATTVMLLGVPFGVLHSEDAQLNAMEQEARMREMGADVLTGGAGAEGAAMSTADRVGAALEAERSLESKAAL